LAISYLRRCPVGVLKHHAGKSVNMISGVPPMTAYLGRRRPKGVPFPGFSYTQGQGQVEVYEMGGKSVIWVFKRGVKNTIFQTDVP